METALRVCDEKQGCVVKWVQYNTVYDNRVLLLNKSLKGCYKPTGEGCDVSVAKRLLLPNKSSGRDVTKHGGDIYISTPPSEGAFPTPILTIAAALLTGVILHCGNGAKNTRLHRGRSTSHTRRCLI